MTKELILKKNNTQITLMDKDDIQSTYATKEEVNNITSESNGVDITLINSKDEISSNGVYFYVEPSLTLTVEGNSITFFSNGYVEQFHEIADNYWLEADDADNILIDWGDGLIDTLPNPAVDSLTHTYTDGLTSHDITFKCNYLWVGPLAFSGCSIEKVYIPTNVDIGNYSFFESYVKNVIINGNIPADSFKYCSQLESIKINNANYIDEAFNGCENLTSVSIPNTVTFMDSSFNSCDNIVDYQLYWTNNNIIDWDNNVMPANENTIFTIPHGETQNYINYNYPEDALVERG